MAGTQRQVLYNDYRERLRQNREVVVRDLDALQVLDHLIAEEVFDLDENDVIRAKPTRKERVVELLAKLPGKGPSAFSHFVDALEETFPDLHESLKADLLVTEVDRESYIRRVLVAGHVPPRPEYFADRPDEVKVLREALRQLQETDGWVVLHGMGGSGKSMLAAEALRDDELLRDCFPDGVFWLTIGQIMDAGQVDAAKLLMKMQNLCARLDPDGVTDRPSNIEAAHDRLLSIFANDYRRALLVLDDVWSQVVSRAFAVRCRCLVTSRSAAVANQTRTPLKLTVPITPGFTLEQTLTVFSHLTQISVENLPQEAKGIHNESQGLPLAVAMLGALLKPDPKQLRWKYYYDILKAKKLKRIGTDSEDSLFVSIAISVEALAESDSAVFEFYKMFAIFDDDPVLSSQVLAVLWDFDDPIEVEIKMDRVLEMSLAHKVPPSQVRFRLKSSSQRPTFRRSGSSTVNANKLVQRDDISPGASPRPREKVKKQGSVFIVDSTPDDRKGKLHRKRSLSVTQFDYAHYSLHDLQLDFLKDELVCDAEKLAMHKRLVDGYTKRCKEEFHKLHDDGYVHRYLGFHLIEAEESARLGTLLTDLRWIEKKLLFAGIDDLLNDYLRFTEHTKRAQEQIEKPQVVAVQPRRRPGRKPARDKSPPKQLSRPTSVDPRVLEEVLTYQRFVSIHAHHLLQEHRVSVIQLALSQPKSSIVYQQALHLAKEETQDLSAFYVRLCNASDDVHSHRLTVRVHQQNVNCVASSPDNRLAVSCSTDMSVRLWNQATGSLVATMEGHDDYVTQCCFNPADSSQIVSCSDDRTVRVWLYSDDRHGMAEQILEYRAAESPVSCCCVSPDGLHCAIGDLDGTLRVFSLSTGQDVFVHTDAHEDAIKGIAWSKDGKFVATVCADSVAKLWSTSAEALLATFRGHKLLVYGCAFSSKSDRLVTCSDDQTLKVWLTGDLTDDSPIATMAKDGVGILCCTFSPDDAIILSGSVTGTVRVWDGRCYDHLYSLDAHNGWVNAVAFIPDGRHFLTCSNDLTCKVWEVTRCGHTSTVRYDRRLNLNVCMETGAVTLACLDKGTNEVKILRGESLEELESHTLEGGEEIKSFALASNRKTVALASASGKFEIRETVPRTQDCDGDAPKSKAPSGAVLCENTSVHKGEVKIVQFSPNCDYIVTASSDGVQAVWHVDGARSKLHFVMSSNMAFRHVPFVFFKDRPWLLSTDRSGGLQVRNLKDGSEVVSWSSGAEDQPLALMVSEDGCVIGASVGYDLLLWSSAGFEAGKSELVEHLKGHTDVIRSLAISPDRKRFATASDDQTIRLYDGDDYSLVEKMKLSHALGWIVDMVFSDASDLLVSISDRIKFWLAEDGTLVRTVYLNGSFTKFIRADSYFSTFATVDNQGTLYLLATVFPDDDDEVEP